ncbi:Methyltransferase domain-containing protein [Halpernia humi]|uniref:Methyltransferase domain-containing protein n=1 Tax=Halpernia humi TaxID=493375 RepID=A0A1H5TVG9_9FLAO|nr:class I SAM-dependent methyltransferase [Halpernia humi]SEF66825.1 Methyltransferase domain-containing protein [Halpernia humi]
MASTQKDYFSEKAEEFDVQSSITQNVGNIGQLILKEIPFSKEMHVMDFGSGTGLLLSQIAPFVKEITAIDISKAMIGVLQSKLDRIECKVQILEMDLTKETLETEFDAIVSSMTIHHIENVQAIFNKFYTLLKDNGSIAIADLDVEDGSFHTEDTGVFHTGFDRNEFFKIAENAGFKDLKIQTASIMEKPTGLYPVFLLTGKK